MAYVNLEEFPIAFQRVQWQYGLVYVKKKSISYCKGKLKISSQWLNWSHLEMTLTGLLYNPQGGKSQEDTYLFEITCLRKPKNVFKC